VNTRHSPANDPKNFLMMFDSYGATEIATMNVRR
jgi:hypothetical protein